jgi:hypothetical protein
VTPQAVPLLLALQVPWNPGWLQASHSPLQAALQQTPCAQNPLVHSLLLVHAAALALRVAHLLVAVLQ